MIYIIDNGGVYSDHNIRFVESDLPLGDMRAIVKAVEYNDEAAIIAVADKVEWREARAQILAEYCEIVARQVGGNHGERKYLGATFKRVPWDGKKTALSRELVRKIAAEYDRQDGSWAATWGYTLEMDQRYPADARAAVMADLAKPEAAAVVQE